ncbi:MAG: YdcH family protein [Hyphomicrobiales bacterium]
MTIQSHLTELERRHEALEQEIRYEHLHPLADSFRMQELKRKKLHLKEQIERIKNIKTSTKSVH